jgi:hypothetical protein
MFTNGYLSTARGITPDMIDIFSGKDCCFFEITVPKDTKILRIPSSIGIFKDEEEVILNRDSELLIKDKQTYTKRDYSGFLIYTKKIYIAEYKQVKLHTSNQKFIDNFNASLPLRKAIYDANLEFIKEYKDFAKSISYNDLLIILMVCKGDEKFIETILSLYNNPTKIDSSYKIPVQLTSAFFKNKYNKKITTSLNLCEFIIIRIILFNSSYNYSKSKYIKEYINSSKINDIIDYVLNNKRSMRSTVFYSTYNI